MPRTSASNLHSMRIATDCPISKARVLHSIRLNPHVLFPGVSPGLTRHRGRFYHSKPAIPVGIAIVIVLLVMLPPIAAMPRTPIVP